MTQIIKAQGAGGGKGGGISGPTETLDGGIVLFDGDNGKKVKDSGVSFEELLEDIDEKVDASELSEVAFSGEYEDIKNTPDLTLKLDKVDTANQIYGTDGSGNQRTFGLSSGAYATTIALRGANGALNVGNPTADTNATTKKYVDDADKVLDDKIKEIQLFKFPNAVIIGEPTINNGQVSGFTANDYMQFPFILDLHDKGFQIDFSFTTGNDVTTQQNILDSQFGLALAIKDGKGLMAISNNGTSWASSTVGNLAIQPNTTYYARLSWNKLQYKTALSTDGTTYTDDMVAVNPTRPFPTTTYIGGCSGDVIGHTAHPFGGTINMNKAYMYANNQLIWQGMDDAGLATRADISLSNLDSEGEARFESKQNKLTVGNGIKIENDVISSDIPFVGGENVTLGLTAKVSVQSLSELGDNEYGSNSTYQTTPINSGNNHRSSGQNTGMKIYFKFDKPTPVSAISLGFFSILTYGIPTFTIYGGNTTEELNQIYQGKPVEDGIYQYSFNRATYQYYTVDIQFYNWIECRHAYLLNSVDGLLQYSDYAEFKLKQDKALVTSLINADNEHYPSAKAVADAITASGGGDMLAANNLSELTNKATARTNLDVYSKSETGTQISDYHDNTKQDVISDLSTIRSGANKGATSLQGFTYIFAGQWTAGIHAAKFVEIDYSDTDSEHGVFFKLTMANSHGNGVAGKFYQDVIINIRYDGYTTGTVYRYFATPAYIGYGYDGYNFGDIFHTVDTVNKKVKFFVLMHQFSRTQMSPYFRLSQSTAGKITQSSGLGGEEYSSGDRIWSIIYNLDNSDVLTKTNTTEFTPTGNYQPATKKYVDDGLVTKITTPSGGNDGQVLTKTASGVEWKDGSGGLPELGETGQVLTVTGKIEARGPMEKGFHVPSRDEWQAVIDAGVSLGAWTSSGGNNFRIKLHMPFAGMRSGYGGNVYSQNSEGRYWSTNRDGDRAYYITFSSSSLSINRYYDNDGYSLRCFKDYPIVPSASWTTIYAGSGGAGIFHNPTEGVISISSNGQTWITIADKNVGATAVYNDGNTLSEANCGKYYQWGNNYGFAWTGTVQINATRVDTSSYGKGNPYSSDMFLVGDEVSREYPYNYNLWGMDYSGEKNAEWKDAKLTVTQVLDSTSDTSLDLRNYEDKILYVIGNTGKSIISATYKLSDMKGLSNTNSYFVDSTTPTFANINIYRGDLSSVRFRGVSTRTRRKVYIIG